MSKIYCSQFGFKKVVINFLKMSFPIRSNLTNKTIQRVAQVLDESNRVLKEGFIGWGKSVALADHYGNCRHAVATFELFGNFAWFN